MPLRRPGRSAFACHEAPGPLCGKGGLGGAGAGRARRRGSWRKSALSALPLPQRQLAAAPAVPRHDRGLPDHAHAFATPPRVGGDARKAESHVHVVDALRGLPKLLGGAVQGQGHEVQDRQHDEVERRERGEQRQARQEVVHAEGEADQLRAQDQHLLHREDRVDVVHDRVAQDRVQGPPGVGQEDRRHHPGLQVPREAERELRGRGRGEGHKHHAARALRRRPPP
mmetsp:Transcript_59183/g.152244  ORF Transcript_59183/g.152244 Transcript_59183/m.152244 type:complete len:226 (-) Transcript_59183:233-910(-)